MATNTRAWELELQPKPDRWGKIFLAEQVALPGAAATVTVIYSSNNQLILQKMDSQGKVLEIQKTAQRVKRILGGAHLGEGLFVIQAQREGSAGWQRNSKVIIGVDTQNLTVKWGQNLSRAHQLISSIDTQQGNGFSFSLLSKDHYRDPVGAVEHLVFSSEGELLQRKKVIGEGPLLLPERSQVVEFFYHQEREKMNFFAKKFFTYQVGSSTLLGSVLSSFVDDLTIPYDYHRGPISIYGTEVFKLGPIADHLQRLVVAQIDQELPRVLFYTYDVGWSEDGGWVQRLVHKEWLDLSHQKSAVRELDFSPVPSGPQYQVDEQGGLQLAANIGQMGVEISLDERGVVQGHRLLEQEPPLLLRAVYQFSSGRYRILEKEAETGPNKGRSAYFVQKVMPSVEGQ